MVAACAAAAPSGRAFEVFQLLEIAGLSTREAARQVGLSQTRVVQLRDTVESWLAEQPSVTDALTKDQRLRLAEYKASERLNHLYSLSLESFRRSQGVETTRAVDMNGCMRSTIRESHGQVRYLQMALRIASQQAKLPVVLLGEAGLRVAAALESTIPEPAERDVDLPEMADAASHVATPSEEDCSLPASEQRESVAAANGEADASCIPQSTCEQHAKPGVAVSATREAKMRPVHLPLEVALEADREVAEEPEFVDPSSLFGMPPLSRKARRKARRLFLQGT